MKCSSVRFFPGVSILIVTCAVVIINDNMLSYIHNVITINSVVAVVGVVAILTDDDSKFHIARVRYNKETINILIKPFRNQTIRITLVQQPIIMNNYL